MPEIASQTVSDLGKAVKAKYAGAYDDLSDDELGRSVKAKYPGAYDDYADVTTATPQTPEAPRMPAMPKPIARPGQVDLTAAAPAQRPFVGPPTSAKSPAIATPQPARPSPFPNVQAPMGLPQTLNPQADIAQMDQHANTVASLVVPTHAAAPPPQTAAGLQAQFEANPPGVPAAPLPAGLGPEPPSPWAGMSPLEAGLRAVAGLDPTGLVAGPVQAGFGVRDIAKAKNLRQAATGATETLGGALEAASPAIAGSAMRDLPGTLKSLGVGTAIDKGVSYTLKKLGVPEEYADLAGAVSGLAGGGATHVKGKGKRAAAPAEEPTNTTGQRPGETPPAEAPQTGAAPAQRVEPTPPMFGKPKPKAPEAPAPEAPATPEGVKEWTGPLTALAHYEALFDEADYAMKRKAAKRPKGERPKAPEHGVPENVARVVDARERLAKQLFDKEWGDIAHGDRETIDEMIREGYGHAVPDRASFQVEKTEVPPAKPIKTKETKPDAQQAQIRTDAAAVERGSEPAADTGRKPDVVAQPGGERAPAVGAAPPAAPERPVSPAAPVAATTPVDDRIRENDENFARHPYWGDSYKGGDLKEGDPGVTDVVHLPEPAGDHTVVGVWRTATATDPLGKLHATLVGPKGRASVVDDGDLKKWRKQGVEITKGPGRSPEEIARLDEIRRKAIEDDKNPPAETPETPAQTREAFVRRVKELRAEGMKAPAAGKQAAAEGYNAGPYGPDPNAKRVEEIDRQLGVLEAGLEKRRVAGDAGAAESIANTMRRLKEEKRGLLKEINPPPAPRAAPTETKMPATETKRATGETATATGETAEAKAARKRAQAKAVEELREGGPSDPVEWARIHARTNPVGTSTQALQSRFPDLTYDEARRIETTVNAEKDAAPAPEPAPPAAPAPPPSPPGMKGMNGAQHAARVKELRKGGMSEADAVAQANAENMKAMGFEGVPISRAPVETKTPEGGTKRATGGTPPEPAQTPAAPAQPEAAKGETPYWRVLMDNAKRLQAEAAGETGKRRTRLLDEAAELLDEAEKRKKLADADAALAAAKAKTAPKAEAQETAQTPAAPPKAETPTPAEKPAPGILDRLSTAGKESEKWLRENGITGGSLSANRALDPEVLFHLTRAVAGDVARGVVTIRDAAQRIVDRLRDKFSDVPPVGVIEDRIRAHLGESPREQRETGPHGPIFHEYSGDPAGAIAKLRREQRGEVPRVWHHPELGWIDLVWGNKSGGLDHIISKHIEGQKDLKPEDLAEMIPQMHVTHNDGRTADIESSDHKAAVRLDYDGKSKKWLVTAYEKKPPAGGYPFVPGSPQSAPRGDGHPPSGGSDSSVAPGYPPKPGSIAQIPTGLIKVDPVRFQFKRDVGQKGVGEELKEIGTFDPELAGIISVWRDPADGQTYVVNGHHRVELAQRTGYPEMTVRYLDAADAQTARLKGALINIAEGRGTALDAAKVFRDGNMGPAELKKRGISLKGAVARTGLGLSQLDSQIFNLVAQGDIPVETAAVIGEMLPERFADQRAVVDMIDKANARGKRMSGAEIREAIRVGLRPDQQLTETQETLFGDITQTRGLFAEVGEISSYIRKKLQQERRLFSSVGSEASAARLGGAGNVIKAEENARIAAEAAQALEVYDKLSEMSGPVSDAISEGAKELAAGGNENAIKERTYERVRRAVSETFGSPAGRTGSVLEGLSGRGEGGGGQTGAGKPDSEAQKEEEDPNLGLFGGRPTTEFMGFQTLASGIARAAKTFGEKDVLPTARAAAAGVRDFVSDALTLLTPTLRSKAGQKGSLIFRARLAELARGSDQARHALRDAIRFFDGQKAKDNFDFIDRMENGQPQKTAALDDIADTLRKLLDERRDAVRALGKGKLQRFYENYFPHIWKDRRRAESIFASFFGKRPLEGGKSFLKQRTLPTFADGINRGLEPVSDNPVDLVLAKLHEMDRFTMAHRTLADWKAAGLARFVDARKGKAPKGWKKIDDSIGTVYGPSIQNIAEYPNEGLYEALKNVVNALGLTHNRGFKNLRGAIGRAHQGGGLIETAHGSKMGTLAHEIGHQIDWLAGSGKRFVLEYPDAQTVARLKRAYATLKDPNSAKADRTAARQELKALKGAIAQRKQFAQELRDLADLRTGGSQAYRRSREEKMAQLAQMWAEGRPLFERTAPTVFREWKKFLDENPKLHALRDIEASANPKALAHPYDVGGLVVRGHYYAPEGAALILNNYLSPGLRRFAGYRAIAGLNNVMNQAQLGLSGFHLGFVSADAAVSKAALGYQALLRGRPFKAARYFAETPVSPLTTYLRGRKGIREWLSPGTQGAAMKGLIDHLQSAGARISMDQAYRTDFIRTMRAALRQGNVLGAAVRSPFAANEALSNILMGHIVPAMKVGAALDLMRFHLGEMDPNTPAEDVMRMLAQDWNSIENRLGEMTYDNLFWNRIGKDIAHLMVRSVGWNIGTLREIGFGIGDVVAQPMNALKGKPVNLNRLSYLAGLVTTTAVMNAVYQYLHTGKPPDELEDYFFPKNGAVDEQGRPQRSSPPTYIKDVYHYATHPGKTLANKIAPVWSAVAEMWNNKDFYGNRIRNADDPLVAQLADVAKHAAKTAIPIGVRNYQRETALGSTPATRAEQFVGMSPAPAELDKTPAERLAAELSAERTGEEPGRPADAAERRDLRLGLSRALRAGKAIPAETLDAIRAGKLTTRDLKLAYTAAHESPLEGAFSRLTIGDALKVYRAATADERLRLKGMLLKKGQTALKSEPPAARVKTLQGLREAFAVQ